MEQLTFEELELLARQTPTRRIVYRTCQDCGHEWAQPAPTGACPACHGTHVVNMGHKISAYRQL